eukprot:scaffold61396_cov63-Phaeocystis_antarctica.AAC.3
MYLGGSSEMIRSLGTTVALSSMRCRRRCARKRLRAWLRVSSHWMSRPFLTRCDLASTRKRACTSGGSQDVSDMSTRKSTLVATLLTFCPPGPLDRECVTLTNCFGTEYLEEPGCSSSSSA